MTRLALRLDKWLEAGDLESGVVARVRRVAEPDGTELIGGWRQDVVIPVSSSNWQKTVDVDPGCYLIEAALPSGEILTEEIVVEIGDNEVVVQLAAPNSPHEWLSWQHFVGAVEDPDSYGRNLKTRLSRDKRQRFLRAARYPLEWLWRNIPGSSGYVDSIVGDFVRDIGEDRATAAIIDQPSSPLAGSAPRGADAWPLLGDLIDHRDPDLRRLGNPAEFHLQDTLVGEPGLSLFRVGPLDGNGRRYFVTFSRRRLELVLLPCPWRRVSTGEDVPLEVLVREQAGGTHTQTSVSPIDPDVGPALAYMSKGAYQTARRLFDEAREMLYYKISNPLAAAAGGYVLLATAGKETDAEWHQWIENLMNWFPEIPDGAILFGLMKLRYRQGDNDLAIARAALIEAFDRGLPYYSIGISRLLDGLTALSSDDQEVAKRAAAVRRVALRTNMNQPFTTIRLGGRRRGS